MTTQLTIYPARRGENIVLDVQMRVTDATGDACFFETIGNFVLELRAGKLRYFRWMVSAPSAPILRALADADQQLVPLYESFVAADFQTLFLWLYLDTPPECIDGQEPIALAAFIAQVRQLVQTQLVAQEAA